MRALFVTALATVTCLSAFSQDTLFTRSGKVIPAKVYEINQSEIKYKKPSNPDGPLYTVSKEDVAVIEYRNGNKDVFESAGQSAAGDDVYAKGGNPPQVNNNYYAAPVPRPNVNVVLGMGIPYMGVGWAMYRPYYRPYYYGGGWGYYRGHHRGYCRRH